MRLVFLFVILSWGAVAQMQPDLVVLNGRIWTGNPAQPEAEAVAIRDGRFVMVGSTAEIQKLAGPATRVVDLGGKRAVPGFNDAHVHFFTGGQHLAGVQLRDAKSEEEFRDRIAAFARKLPAGRWILGGDWDHENWTPARLPTRQWIDSVTPDHPVYINRLDGHMSLANSMALKLAKITKATPDPPGGAIVRDAKGEPTGVLKDAAEQLMFKVMPPSSDEEIADALKAAMKYAAENGVTSVQDMSASPDDLRVYQKLKSADALTVRVYGCQPLATWERLAVVGIRQGFGDDMLKIGCLKGFADGSLGSTTALFFKPYLNEPKTIGLASEEMIPERKMFDRILAADAAGFQVNIHAIGDRANRMILNMFEETERKNGLRDRRFRIEHAQHLDAFDIPRFGQTTRFRSVLRNIAPPANGGKLGVVASMQPYHAIDDGRWAEKRIGPERAKGTYAFRSLLDAGAILAFGSDWFVAPMEPLLGIYAAVTRRTLDDKNPDGWIPQQKITVAEAVRAYTFGSAFASFDEQKKGTIDAGKLADLAVLSDDIFNINPAEIAKAKVTMTIMNGRIVFQR